MSFFYYQGQQVYYSIVGKGEPLLILHGNTSSSKMFEPLLPLYKHYQVILIDFLGYGRSQRVEKFPDELWKDEAQQVIALLEFCQLGPVNVIGTSGGAWVAINVALERSDLIKGVIADSFDGRTLHEGFKESMIAEREMVKKDVNARQFYEWCIGNDWEQVVELDTDSLVRFVDSGKEVFVKPLVELGVPLLLLGSKEDQMLRKDLEKEYQEIVTTCPNARYRLFDHGSHPAIGTNAEAVAEAIDDFISV